MTATIHRTPTGRLPRVNPGSAARAILNELERCEGIWVRWDIIEARAGDYGHIRETLRQARHRLIATGLVQTRRSRYQQWLDRYPPDPRSTTTTGIAGISYHDEARIPSVEWLANRVTFA